MRCSSRDSNRLGDRNFPGPDEWRTEPDGTRTCSFCGSLHPDDFIDILEHYIAGDDGYYYDPSIKNYKRYAHRPNVKNAGDGGIKFYGWHSAEETAERIDALDKQAREKHNTWMHQRFGDRGS